MTASFALLYLRPEIASGYYHFPVDPAEPITQEAEQAEGAASPSPALLPGVPPEEAGFFLPNGQIVNAIKQRLELSGFSVADERVLRLSKPQLRRLQFAASSAANDDEQTRAAFLDQFASGPTLILLLTMPSSDPDAAVVALQALVGPEDPPNARKHALGAGIPVDQWPLRAICGVSSAFPGVYASANLDCVTRERLELFPTTHAPLESAVVALLPVFLAAIPDVKAIILSQFNRHGIVVTSMIDTNSFSSEQLTFISAAELHASTADADRETFRSQLHSSTDGSLSLVLRVVGFHLDAVLRQIFGPASVACAQRFFPDSLRAQLTSAPFVALEDHIKSRENTATCLETGVFISQRPPVIELLAPEIERIDSTFAIIKPNAACDCEVVEQILQAIRRFGFSIDKQRRMRLSQAQAATFYAEHTGKGFFERLLEFMTSGEIVALQLSRKLAIPMWRALMGPTNCLVARETHPWTLRARFGIDGTKNATHGSDALASARRELRFFFGASTHNAPVVADIRDHGAGKELALSAVHVANAPLALPYTPTDSLEKVLVRGLDAMLQHQQQQPLEGPLSACRWLGEWLLMQSELQNQGADSSEAETKTSSSRPAARAKAAKASARTPPQSTATVAFGASHKVVAIVLDASLPGSFKEAAHTSVRLRAEAAGYAFVGVGSPAASVDALVRQVHDAGRRRVVLFDWASDSMGDAWAQTSGAFQISSLVTIAADSATVTASSGLHFLHTHVAVPASETDIETALSPLFHSVLDPVVWLVDGNDNPSSSVDWQRLASRFGLAFVSFDALVVFEIARERDPNGEFTQWKRTNASLPTATLLDAVRRVVLDPVRMDFDGANHKFLLYGFPWSSMDSNMIEKSIGRVTGVLQVGSSPRDWSRGLLKRGALYTVSSARSDEAARALAPSVTFVVGDGDASSVRSTASQQGAAWIDVASLPPKTIASPEATVVTLRQIILGKSRGRQRVVLCGYPRSQVDAKLFLQQVTLPSAIVVAPQKSTPSADHQALLTFLQREAPHVVQSVVSSTVHRLRGLLHGKSVAFAVGDHSSIDASLLRSALKPFGFNLIDLRDQKPLSPVAMLDSLSCCVSPRCLVIGGASNADYFRSVHAALGDALVRVLVLKQRKQQPPPKPRGDDDDYDSEEEAEREKQRQREATTLSPELTQLVQAFAAKPVLLRVDVVSFLRPQQAYDAIVGALQPRVVAVLGHSHTFYRDAACAVCLAQQLPFVDMSVASDSKAKASHSPQDYASQLSRLHDIVAASGSPTLVVDGFPRSVRVDDDALVPPYAAQQVLLLEKNVARLPLVVRFHAALDVLLEKKPASVSRNALEDAQDTVDDATSELVECFRQAKATGRSLRHVSCERELQDAQDEFTDVLRSQGILRQQG